MANNSVVRCPICLQPLPPQGSRLLVWQAILRDRREADFWAREADYLEGKDRDRHALGDQFGAAVRHLWPWMPAGNPYRRLMRY